VALVSTQVSTTGHFVEIEDVFRLGTFSETKCLPMAGKAEEYIIYTMVMT